MPSLRLLNGTILIASIWTKPRTAYALDRLSYLHVVPDPMPSYDSYIPWTPVFSNLAGPPCRSILSQYQHVDLLSNYIIPVKLPTHHDQLSAVTVENILSKVV